MALVDDLQKAATDTLVAGATAARNQGLALAADFESLVRPNLLDVSERVAAITAARIAGTINDDLAKLNLQQQFERIADLAIGQAELVVLAVQNILNAIIDALRAVVNAASTRAIGIPII